MKSSKKAKIAVVLLMIASSACFSQKWKEIVKGIEGRVGGNTSSQSSSESSSQSSADSASGGASSDSFNSGFLSRLRSGGKNSPQSSSESSSQSSADSASGGASSSSSISGFFSNFRSGGKYSDISTYKSKKPMKLSKEASVQKHYKLYEKAENALLKKDYKTSRKYYEEAGAVPFTEVAPEADTLALMEWAGEMGKYIQTLNAL